MQQGTARPTGGGLERAVPFRTCVSTSPLKKILLLLLIILLCCMILGPIESTSEGMYDVPLRRHLVTGILCSTVLRTAFTSVLLVPASPSPLEVSGLRLHEPDVKRKEDN